jgi:hypothetical protein
MYRTYNLLLERENLTELENESDELFRLTWLHVLQITEHRDLTDDM